MSRKEFDRYKTMKKIGRDDDAYGKCDFNDKKKEHRKSTREYLEKVEEGDLEV